MKILFDFGHPADVHYFRHLIFYLIENGNRIKVLARDKDVTLDLLNAYQIPHTNKGKGGSGFFDRVKYTAKSIRMIRTMIKDFKPDLCISHASPYLATAAGLSGTPHIMFNDTEGALFFKPLVKLMRPHAYSPVSFKSNLNGDYLKRFPSYMELAYLHPDVYQPDQSILDKTGDDYVLLRFVANKATHDIGHKHLKNDYKKELVRRLSECTNVLISSESPLSSDLQSYGLNLPPSQIHDVIAHSKLVVSEGATFCSEAAMLGVPSIFINENKLGYITELEQRYRLIEQFSTDKKSRQEVVKRAISLIRDPKNPEIYATRREIMLKDKENMASMMIQIVEHTAAEIGKSIYQKVPA